MNSGVNLLNFLGVLMKYANRNGKRWDSDSKQDRFLKRVYNSVFGRCFIKSLTLPVFSKIGGLFMSSPFSKPMIKGFVRKNNIDLHKCEKVNFKSYNDFFTRKVTDDNINIDMVPKHLISPCDSKLFVSKISEDELFYIKNTNYTVGSLLQDNILAGEYIGGTALIFRLTVDDYHRYSYFDNGEQVYNKFIKGKLHTVNPIANDFAPVYKENCREFSIIKTENFGKAIFMEVGALMVGKISNHKKTGHVKRGEEKGMFEFGGSTIILLLKENSVSIDEDILANSADGYETIVKLGEKIGLSSL